MLIDIEEYRIILFINQGGLSEHRQLMNSLNLLINKDTRK